MGKAGDAWSDAATYAAAVAGVEERYHRELGVPAERLADMRATLRTVQRGDPEAFRAVISKDYASEAAAAVARMIALRAEAEQEAEAVAAAAETALGPPIGDDDPTPAT